MAVETYGVDEAYLSSHYAQDVATDSRGPLTATKLSEIIQDASAEVNGILLSAFGSDAPAMVAANAGSEACRNVRRIIAKLALPRILQVSQGVSASEAAVELAQLEANREMGRLKARPTFIGPIGAGSSTPSVRTSTGRLDTDEGERRYGERGTDKRRW